MKTALAFAFVFFFLRGAAAGEIEISGDFVQGGLVIGQAPQASEVLLDGKRVALRPGGRFLIGFDHDAPPSARLSVVFADGKHEDRILAIAQRDYDVQRIDGLPQNQVTPNADELARIDRERQLVANARAVDSPAAMFDAGFIWPAAGPISGVYGSRRVLNGAPRQPHFGVDVAAPEGAPVVAPAPGIVRLAAADLFYTGGTVILDHGYGLSSTFMHMSAVEVEVGDELAQGDPIGRVGATGRVTGPHLDWRMNLFEIRLDPALLLDGPPPAAQ